MSSSSPPSYTKVQEWGLFIGDKKTARDRDLLASLGISRIVNVTSEIRNYFEDERDHFQYLKCPCVDSDVADLSQYFERACGFIHDAHEHGHAVLVHCQQGVSRSASIIIAYLIKHGGMSLSAAYPYVRKLRNEVKPKGNFLVQLTRFEQSIIKRTASLAARMAITVPTDDTADKKSSTPSSPVSKSSSCAVKLYDTSVSSPSLSSSALPSPSSLTLKRKASGSAPSSPRTSSTTPSSPLLRPHNGIIIGSSNGSKVGSPSLRPLSSSTVPISPTRRTNSSGANGDGKSHDSHSKHGVGSNGDGDIHGNGNGNGCEHKERSSSITTIASISLSSKADTSKRPRIAPTATPAPPPATAAPAAKRTKSVGPMLPPHLAHLG